MCSSATIPVRSTASRRARLAREASVTPISAAAGRAPRRWTLDRFELDSGAVLRDVQVAYHLDGPVAAVRDRLVVAIHSLTGHADAVGDWWGVVLGPGRAVDTRHQAVLSANLLGSCYGTTGPSTLTPFPAVSTRDQARLLGRLVRSLGTQRVALVTGGSLGGMVALEFAALHHDLVERTVVFAAPAAHTAQAVAFNHVQRLALELGGPERGLALARQIAMLTYRTDRELETRFARRSRQPGRFDVESWLSHHGRKLVARFDAATYRTLLDAMDSHDLGRGRGGETAALRSLPGRVWGVGIPGDQLYAAEVVRAWTTTAGATYRELTSVTGHDAFLLEPDQVGAILSEALATPVVLPTLPTADAEVR